jgi:hypothetical protein
MNQLRPVTTKMSQVHRRNRRRIKRCDVENLTAANGNSHFTPRCVGQKLMELACTCESVPSNSGSGCPLTVCIAAPKLLVREFKHVQQLRPTLHVGPYTTGRRSTGTRTRATTAVLELETCLRIPLRYASFGIRFPMESVGTFRNLGDRSVQECMPDRAVTLARIASACAGGLDHIVFHCKDLLAIIVEYVSHHRYVVSFNLEWLDEYPPRALQHLQYLWQPDQFQISAVHLGKNARCRHVAWLYFMREQSGRYSDRHDLSAETAVRTDCTVQTYKLPISATHLKCYL